MIKFNRIDTNRAKEAKKSLAIQKSKNGTYNTPEVLAALKEMFYGKCYICESKDTISSYQIEHLIPHEKDVELKFDWDNLFLSCAHCNNIKGTKYNPILDCSKIDVDHMIAFRKEGWFGEDEKYVFVPLDGSIETQNTVRLLGDVYNGTTLQKKLEASNIRRILRRNLADFKNLVREYDDAEGYDKASLKSAIKEEVSQGAAFAAFKRWLLWDHKERYGELIQYCGL